MQNRISSRFYTTKGQKIQVDWDSWELVLGCFSGGYFIGIRQIVDDLKVPTNWNSLIQLFYIHSRRISQIFVHSSRR